jgi:LysM repeat protein
VVLTTIYTVQSGDTLSSIARRFRTSVSDLLRRNGMGNADFVYVGQRLEVPVPPELLEPGGGSGAGSEAAPTRLQFAAGATSASVQGLITFPQRACYVLGADAGQDITVSISSGSDLANFLVRAADAAVNGGVPLKRLENEDRRWQYILPISGDYVICVATPEGAVAYTLTVSIPAGCTSVTQAIEVVDWAAHLAADPALTTELIDGERYVTVAASTTGTAGIPQLEQIAYGDFDGDCMEEAGIPLFSGGTAGNIGFLVYNMAEETTSPTLAAWGDGYKLGLTADAGLLVVSNALYSGWEPNCCPSGFLHEGYRLRNDTLTLVYSTSEGTPEMGAETVRHFYTLLQAKNYTDAYALLAAEFQNANPFATWTAGYGNTQSFEATVAADPDVTNRVTVTLAVTESLNNGLTRLRHYSGYWDVVWDDGSPGWRLQDGQFTVVP